MTAAESCEKGTSAS